MNGRSWVGKKGRTLKDNVCTGVKHHPYAYSDMITEINSITSLFTEKQKLMAESTGFKLFAKPLHPLLFDKQFQVWLMPKVDTMGRTIAANGGRRLMIFQEDVSAVFGTPSSGKEVYDASLDKSQAMRTRIEEILGMEDENSSPTLAARKTLRALAGKEITAADEKTFKTSFVVAVIGFLCDSKNPGDRESVNFWPALSEPDIIHQFNWSSYVLDSVFSACASARMATRTNTPYSPPTGTAMFLQVLVAHL
jgi:hypothetical protein